MRVLVTGGAGFIGSGVVDVLSARGEEVLALDVAPTPRLAALLDRPSVSFAPCEITEWPQVADAMARFRPETVVHCAAVVGVTNSLKTPFWTFRVNVDGSLNVLEAMRLFGARRFVHLSSEETYGPFEADVIDETHPNRPLAPYGISKFAVERLACGYVDAYGLECINVRTCWVYGPGLPRPRVPKILVDAAVEGRPLHLDTGGDFVVDHVYIDDCVDGIVKVIDHDKPPHDVYHIASGRAVSLAEIVAILKDLVPGADLSVGPGPYRFVDGTVALRKGTLDIARARADLGYEPRYPIEKGLAATVAAARAGRG